MTVRTIPLRGDRDSGRTGEGSWCDQSSRPTPGRPAGGTVGAHHARKKPRGWAPDSTNRYRPGPLFRDPISSEIQTMLSLVGASPSVFFEGLLRDLVRDRNGWPVDRRGQRMFTDSDVLMSSGASTSVAASDPWRPQPSFRNPIAAELRRMLDLTNVSASTFLERLVLDLETDVDGWPLDRRGHRMFHEQGVLRLTGT